MAMLKTVKTKTVKQAPDAELASIRGYLVNPKVHRRIERTLNDVKNYLVHGSPGERVENRAVVSRDSDNLFYLWDSQTWVDAMMETKLQYGKLDGRSYYHFIVSPDPDDHVSPQECLDLAADWVEESFPGSEWHIDVHDDNTNKIPHAHVIVNSVYPGSGRKVHQTKADIIQEARILQRLCSERGLNVLPDLAQKAGVEAKVGERADRLRASTAVDTVEAAMRREGRISWRSLIRDKVDDAARHNANWTDFVENLREDGIEVEQRRRGITFVLVDFNRTGPRRIKGSTLGEGYTKYGLLHRMRVDWDSLLGVTLDAQGNPAQVPVKVYYPSVDHRKDEVAIARRTSPRVRRRTYGQILAERAGGNKRWSRLDGLFDALWTVEREEISSRAELDRIARSLSVDVYDAEDRVRRYAQGVDRAMEIAKRGKQVRDDEAWLRPMRDKRIWRPAERREVREREARLAENRAYCSDQLKSAEAWLVATGHDLNDPYRCALDLATDLRKTGERYRDETRDLSRRARALRDAQRVIAEMSTTPTPEDLRGRPRSWRNREAYEQRKAEDMHILPGMKLDTEHEDKLSAAERRVVLRRIGQTLAQPNGAIEAAEAVLRRREEESTAAGRQLSNTMFAQQPEQQVRQTTHAPYVPSTTRRGEVTPNQ